MAACAALCVCLVFSLFTHELPHISVVTALVDRATFQSASSSPWLMACWRLPLMKMRSPPLARLFCSVGSDRCAVSMGRECVWWVFVLLNVHVTENHTAGRAFTFEWHVWCTVCRVEHLQNLHKLHAHPKVAYIYSCTGSCIQCLQLCIHVYEWLSVDCLCVQPTCGDKDNKWG